MAVQFVCEEVSGGAGWILLWPTFFPNFFCLFAPCLSGFRDKLLLLCLLRKTKPKKKKKRNTPPAFWLKTMLSKASRK